MNKTKLFVDFDGTIVDTVKSLCDIYNSVYEGDKDFKRAIASKAKKWNLEDECPLFEGRLTPYFNSTDFFDNLRFMEGAYDYLKKLNEQYQLIVCTIGTYSNIENKSRWIKQNLPFIKECIFINNYGIDSVPKMNKHIIDMSGGIFIDDHSENLKTSNADVNICFGRRTEWNNDWDGFRFKSWESLFAFLNGGEYIG